MGEENAKKVKLGSDTYDYFIDDDGLPVLKRYHAKYKMWIYTKYAGKSEEDSEIVDNHVINVLTNYFISTIK